ncbi:MAG: hypothetical protein KDD06_03315 [Phaeodactylibacter sp.]|nr:hypothetical protein [Phaeodactylibacter sp.]
MKKLLLFFIWASFIIPQNLQADVCTWLGQNRNWDEPNRWSCGHVPGPGDTVIIATNNRITRHSGLTVQSLSIMAPGAILVVQGDLTVNGAFIWEAGKIEGSGNTIANSGIAFQGSQTKTLQDRSLSLHGNSTWPEGMIVVPQSHPVTIAAGATLAITGADILRPYYPNMGILVNNGTILKSAGAKTAFELVNFTNNGLVQIDTGTLEFRGGNASGQFHANNSGILQLYQNTLNLNAGSGITGSGLFRIGPANPVCNIYLNATLACAVEITAGLLNIEQDVTVPSLETGDDPAITITGSGSLTVTSLAAWNGGAITNLLGGARFEGDIRLAGSKKTLSGTSLDLVGNSTWEGGEIRLQPYGRLRNLGIWADSLTATQSVQRSPASAPGVEFVNEGTYIRDYNTLTEINVPFHNNGSVFVNSGTLQVEEGTSSGQVVIAAGASFRKTGSGNYSFPGGRVSGAGELVAAGGTSHMEAGANLDANLRINSGAAVIWDFPDSIGYLALDGGALYTGSTLYVTEAFSCNSNDNVLAGGGTIKTLGGATFASSGTLEIQGCTLELESNSSWVNGSIRFGSNGVIRNKAGKVFSINLPQGRSIHGTGSGHQFINEGTVRKLSDTRLVFNPSVAVTNTGTFEGIGILDFKQPMQNGGIIAPGLWTGELVLAGSVANNNQLNFELRKNGGSLQYDEMPIWGNLDLGGTLQVAVSGNVPPGEYMIIHCDSLAACLSGTFDQALLPPGASLSYTPNAVTLHIGANARIQQANSEQNAEAITKGTQHTLDLEINAPQAMEEPVVDITVYPNPFAEWLEIKTADADASYTCILYDGFGKEAWRAAVNGERLAVPSLPTGFYVLAVVDESSTFVFSQKMLKQ